jgi:hypothetical protein
MAATLTPTLTLTSTDATGASLSLSVTDALSIGGKSTARQVVTSDTETLLLDSNDFTNTTWVYLKNMSTTAAEIIHITEGSIAGTHIMDLGASEFAFFPWSGDTNLNFDAATGTPTLEYRTWQVSNN